jgi:Sec-independent protein translocase protein TatA
VSLGTELLLVLLLGFLILGPKQVHGLAGRIACAKTEFDKVTRSLKSHFSAKTEIPAPNHELPTP